MKTRLTVNEKLMLMISLLGTITLFTANTHLVSAKDNKDVNSKKQRIYGKISTSEAKVWREGQAQPFLADQLKMIENEGKSADLKNLQGRRSRASSTTIQVQGAAKLALEPVQIEQNISTEITKTETVTQAGDTTSTVTETITKTVPVKPETIEPVSAQPGLLTGVNVKAIGEGEAKPVITYKSDEYKIVPDPIDQLTRVDDYYGVFEGIRLSRLRDSSSLEKEWSMYMLGFDISVRPGSLTRKNYQAVATYEIKGIKFGSTNSDAEKLKNNVRIYSITPQRYALRYGEEMQDYLRLMAQAEVSAPANPGTGWAVSGEVKSDRQYMEALEHIQRYPLISGFIDGKSFGWVFNPRPRITTTLTKRVKITGEMVDDTYHCTALIMVKDEGFSIDKWIYALDKKTIYGYFGVNYYNESNWDCKFPYVDPDKLAILWELYMNYINNYTIVKEEEIINDQEINYDRKKVLKAYKNWQESGDAGTFPINGLHQKVFGNNDVTIHKISDSDAFQKREALAYNWFRLHEDILKRKGNFAQPLKLTIDFTSEWRYHPMEGRSLWLSVHPAQGNPVAVSLPEKIDRTLMQLDSVKPSTAPGNQESWLRIQGYGFGNDLEVLIGSQKAKEIQVVGNDLILVKIPKYYQKGAEDNAPEKVSIQVFTGGEKLSCNDCFSYVKPFDKLDEKKEPKPVPLDLVTTQGKSGDYIKIKSTEPIMDKVNKVMVGNEEVRDIEVVPEKDKKDQNKEIQFCAPKQYFTSREREYSITIFFKENVEINGIKRDRFALDKKFNYIESDVKQ